MITAQSRKTNKHFVLNLISLQNANQQNTNRQLQNNNVNGVTV